MQSCYGRVKSITDGTSKIAFSVSTQWKMPETGMKMMYIVVRGPSLCFASHICTESAIFATTTNTFDTALTRKTKKLSKFRV